MKVRGREDEIYYELIRCSAWIIRIAIWSRSTNGGVSSWCCKKTETLIRGDGGKGERARPAATSGAIEQ